MLILHFWFTAMREIVIENAHENNLKNVSLHIPHYQLIVVTGVSGSGKTSLVYDVLSTEGRRLFYENFVGGRYAEAKLSRPKASHISGLFPVIAIDQNNVVRSPRSTVGTLTELYDLLRLLFARLGHSDLVDVHPYRSLFSFNLPDGCCLVCKGLGVQDHIDPALLIADEKKTIREGAFALTTPNNYIIYSQVTMDVLNQVCQSEGFNVDIPWRELTDYQKNVVLNGSEKIKVLFGKHTLESRLKWSGITAKPREEDYYKGILPVMEDILRRDRNPNIMRFARSHKCTCCNGRRLNNNALSVKLWNRDITEYSAMSIDQLYSFFSKLGPDEKENAVVSPVRDEILRRTALLKKLGAGHLSLDRESMTLSGGEAQRIKLANHVCGEMRNVLYIIDEPSAGLHPSEHRDLLEILRSLVRMGNTVMLIDHDEQSIREADWIIDIGPGAGINGGEILFNGKAESFFGEPHPASMTWKYLTENKTPLHEHSNKTYEKKFNVPEADKNNLRKISPEFLVNAFNVITGVSGSGKTSLVNFLIEKTIPGKKGSTDVFNKIIHIDSSPIGRTPKSNPATYTGMSDHIRDLLASMPESHDRGFRKGQFSFVVKGGRCENCGGAGYVQVGMHFLGNVQVECDVCEGKRFTQETLEIRYHGLNIFDMLELTVDEAHLFFEGQKKITSITGILSDLGLGYLKLGQPSTTLSGGEAQRVKLASELSRPSTGNTLYILDEPTTALHMADVEILMKALRQLVLKGNTLLCIEHDPSFILNSDWMVELGPGSAENGGEIVVQGMVNDLIANGRSKTIEELKSFLSRNGSGRRTSMVPCDEETTRASISLYGVRTNNLKNIDVSFPVDTITSVTGVSGSGKSSLVYGTLHSEIQKRFMEGMASQVRQYSVKNGYAVLDGSNGLIPSVALKKKNAVKNPRSTIATYTGLYDLYRLMFSRLSYSDANISRPLSTGFSFNGEEGACHVCKGLGAITVCSENKLVTYPHKALTGGALDGTKTGKFYGDIYGQYVATLITAGKKYGIDFSIPYKDITEISRKIAMEGCGDEIFDVEWHYKRGNHEGVHRLKTAWPGFLHLVEEEYGRKHADARGDAMLDLMEQITCKNCNGFRLKPEMLSFRIDGLNIGELTAFSTQDALSFFSDAFTEKFISVIEKESAKLFKENITGYLEALMKAGLGYIATDRIVGTLSGGEFQRLQLAGLARAPMNGVAYLLDEPSFGLHPKDTILIGDLISNLHQNGNTVIMVENSPLLLEKSQNTIELGPGSGKDGGVILYSGKTKEYSFCEKDIADLKINAGSPGNGLIIKGACANNLRNIDLSINPGIMTVITGVSGSGKTSLVDKVIYESLVSEKPLFCKEITGFENFDDIIYIEQPVPGKGYNATVGTRLKISEYIAKIFAGSDKSRSNGFKTSHFINGSREGRCQECEGTGENKTSMDFFSDVSYPCEKCDGTGFRDEIMEIRVDGKTVYDVLQIPVSELQSFFNVCMRDKQDKNMTQLIGLMVKTGLGHLSCGRTLQTLSTGELQRLKLVSGLSSKKGNRNLIMLDEPTGGLHPKDTRKLLLLFRELIEEGNTILCISHEPILLAAASSVIELGPGGGSNGGRVLKNECVYI
jgi:excinuclease ABC subunit A